MVMPPNNPIPDNYTIVVECYVSILWVSTFTCTVQICMQSLAIELHWDTRRDYLGEQVAPK